MQSAGANGVGMRGLSGRMLMLFIGAFLATALLFWLTLAVQAGRLDVGPNHGPAAVDLPPRPTLTPTPTATPVRGASIRLAVSMSTGEMTGAGMMGLRSGVQWQDKESAWHDVEGWQADLSGSEQTWWVTPWHFGTGPFRWVLYAGPDDTPLAISESFTLPTEAYTRVDLMLVLSAQD